MIFKTIKSIYSVSRKVLSTLGFKGIKRLYSFLEFSLRIGFYIWLDHKDFRNDSFLFYLCTKIDPFLLVPKEERDKKRAEWILNQILIHGTTFIKLGQILATRADLI